eukprot:6190094-Pleurochrysis_carterae.AAC.4
MNTKAHAPKHAKCIPSVSSSRGTLGIKGTMGHSTDVAGRAGGRFSKDKDVTVQLGRAMQLGRMSLTQGNDETESAWAQGAAAKFRHFILMG